MSQLEAWSKQEGAKVLFLCQNSIFTGFMRAVDLGLEGADFYRSIEDPKSPLSIPTDNRTDPDEAIIESLPIADVVFIGHNNLSDGIGQAVLSHFNHDIDNENLQVIF